MEDKTAFRIKISKILGEILGHTISQSQLTDDTDLIDDLGLNSLDFLQFILKIENEFDIEIDIEKLEIRYFKKLIQLEEFINETKNEQI